MQKIEQLTKYYDIIIIFIINHALEINKLFKSTK